MHSNYIGIYIVTIYSNFKITIKINIYNRLNIKQVKSGSILNYFGYVEKYGQI